MEENTVELDVSTSITDNRTILDANDVNDTELHMLKGDTIGDTVYSGKWVLTTLMSLSKVYETGWTSRLENDLCMLWDMSTEKDVALYLMENEFLDIAEITLQNSDERRLMEILVGIIGNICCETEILHNIGNNKGLVEAVLNLLLLDDTETLIQVFRVLQAAVCDIRKHTQSVWAERLHECQFLGDAVLFVLNSSTNDILLTAAINFIYAVLDVQCSHNNSFLEGILDVKDLIPALSESFTQLFPEGKDYAHQTCSKVIKNWLTVISNLTKMEMIELNEKSKNEHLPKIMRILLFILQPYKDAWSLVPMDESIFLCIHQCLEIALWFLHHQLSIIPELSNVIAAIICRMKYDNNSECPTTLGSHEEELLIDLETYWMEILDICTTNDLREICRITEPRVVKNLILCLKSHPKSSNSQMDKLVQVASELEIV